jgi:hypothetical protein
MRRTFALLLAGAALAAPSVARADDLEPELRPFDEGKAFQYANAEQVERQRLRAWLEEGIVLGGGFVEYLIDLGSNRRDFDMGWNWKSLESKLTLSSVAFDTNNFATNWATHPLAGYFYYTAARSNRLSVAESFGMAIASSTIWEYVGELREQASVNDMIATPVSGLAVGEPLLQLGALFQRSRHTPLTRALQWTFGPLKSMHDAIDGAIPEAPDSYDELGLPGDTWHRFQLSAGGGVTHQDRSTNRWAEASFALSSRVVTLPYYGTAGNHEIFFVTGDVTSIDFRMTRSAGEFSDMRVATSVMPAGWYQTEVGHDARGRLEGHTTTAGLEVGFEYGGHDWDRDEGGSNRIAMVDAGVSLEHMLHLGPMRLTTSAEALGDFAGVDAYALREYRRRGGPQLTTVVQSESYYHGLGVTLRPRVTLAVGRFETGASVRADWFEMITQFDRNRPPGPIAEAYDRRIESEMWMGARLSNHVRARVSAGRNERAGSINEVHAERGETTAGAALDLLF